MKSVDRIIDGVDSYSGFLNMEYERKIPTIWIFPTHGDTWFRMPHLSLRKGNYTLIGTFPEKPDTLNLLGWMKTSVPVKYELYDLSVDIEQTIDLSDIKTDILQGMIPEMNRLWLEIRNEGPWYGR